MALDLTLSEGVAIATLVVNILGVLCVLPFLLVAFGFFPDSGFAHRVHPCYEDALKNLSAQQKDTAEIRRDVEMQLECFETQTDAIITIGEKLKEKMD